VVVVVVVVVVVMMMMMMMISLVNKEQAPYVSVFNMQFCAVSDRN
jgi:hypothetical protein